MAKRRHALTITSQPFVCFVLRLHRKSTTSDRNVFGAKFDLDNMDQQDSLLCPIDRLVWSFCDRDILHKTSSNGALNDLLALTEALEVAQCRQPFDTIRFCDTLVQSPDKLFELLSKVSADELLSANGKQLKARTKAKGSNSVSAWFRSVAPTSLASIVVYNFERRMLECYNSSSILTSPINGTSLSDYFAALAEDVREKVVAACFDQVQQLDDLAFGDCREECAASARRVSRLSENEKSLRFSIMFDERTLGAKSEWVANARVEMLPRLVKGRLTDDGVRLGSLRSLSLMFMQHLLRQSVEQRLLNDRLAQMQSTKNGKSQTSSRSGRGKRGQRKTLSHTSALSSQVSSSQVPEPVLAQSAAKHSSEEATQVLPSGGDSNTLEGGRPSEILNFSLSQISDGKKQLSLSISHQFVFEDARRPSSISLGKHDKQRCDLEDSSLYSVCKDKAEARKTRKKTLTDDISIPFDLSKMNRTLMEEAHRAKEEKVRNLSSNLKKGKLASRGKLHSGASRRYTFSSKTSTRSNDSCELAKHTPEAPGTTDLQLRRGGNTVHLPPVSGIFRSEKRATPADEHPNHSSEPVACVEDGEKGEQGGLPLFPTADGEEESTVQMTPAPIGDGSIFLKNKAARRPVTELIVVERGARKKLQAGRSEQNLSPSKSVRGRNFSKAPTLNPSRKNVVTPPSKFHASTSTKGKPSPTPTNLPKSALCLKDEVATAGAKLTSDKVKRQDFREVSSDARSYFKTQVNASLEQMHAAIVGRTERLKPACERVLAFLTETASKLFSDFVAALPYGSFLTNLMTRFSDLDVCLTFCQSAFTRPDALDYLTKLAKALKESEAVASVEAIFTATVPILKVAFNSHLVGTEPGLCSGVFDADLSVFSHSPILYHIMPLRTSYFAKVCVETKPFLGALTVVVKHILCSKGLVGSLRGGVNSFGVFLLALASFTDANAPPVACLGAAFLRLCDYITFFDHNTQYLYVRDESFSVRVAKPTPSPDLSISDPTNSLCFTNVTRHCSNFGKIKEVFVCFRDELNRFCEAAVMAREEKQQSGGHAPKTLLWGGEEEAVASEETRLGPVVRLLELE